MQYAQINVFYFNFFRYFFHFPIDKGIFLWYIKGAKETDARLKKEDTPMQNDDKPGYLATYRLENEKIASILCLAIGQ